MGLDNFSTATAC